MQAFEPRQLDEDEDRSLRMELRAIGESDPGPGGDLERSARVDEVMRRYGLMPPIGEASPAGRAPGP